MNIYPEFPANRLNNPKRQAELSVYRELEASDAAGTVIYEARPDPSCPEVDFVIWLEGVARIAMQVKGGQYRIERGRWYLATPNGEEKKSTPAKQAWESALALHNHLQERISDARNPFVVPVLLFPDMEPDADIETWAAQARIHVLFGGQRLVERLEELAAVSQVRFPPTEEEIAEEVELVMPGVAEVADPAPSVIGLQARQVIIQHANVVNIHTTAVDGVS